MSISIEKLKGIAESVFEEWTERVEVLDGHVAVYLDDLFGHHINDIKHQLQNQTQEQYLDWYCTGTGAGLVLVLKLKEKTW